MTINHTSTATFKTAKASRYLQTMCKHFGHKLKIEFTPENGLIDFPFGHCKLMACDTELNFLASAETEESLEKLQDVLGSHLERFAFREELSLNWE